MVTTSSNSCPRTTPFSRRATYAGALNWWPVSCASTCSTCRSAMAGDDVRVVLHLVVAFVLTYALGFERELRGSPAGDRTFSLIGLGTALIGILSRHGAPFALAGAVT